MKTLLLFLALALPLSATPLLFEGRIYYTFTALNNAPAGFQAGDTFSGWYGYEADSSDGWFGHAQLLGGIDAPSWFSADFLAFADENNCFLHVVDGLASFSWGGDYGPASLNFYGGTFNLCVDGAAYGSGTVRLSDPMPVPDGLSVGLAVVAVVGVMGWARRIFT